MTPITLLKPEKLCVNCDPTKLGFDTTDELDDLTDFIGQERAIEAIRFGVTINRSGYNIFALGPSGTGKYTLVHQFVQNRAASEPVPDDWCYVNNFDQPHKPNALRLPPGMARQFRDDMSQLIDDLQTGLSSALESEEYQTRRQVLAAEFRERQQESLQVLQNNAQERGLTLLQTPAGFAFAPVQDGNVIATKDFQKLPDEEQKRLESEINALQTELQATLQQVPRWERELRARIRDLNREVTGFVIQDAMNELRNAYSEHLNMAGYLDGVNKYLDAIQNDITENLCDFLIGTDSGDPSSGSAGGSTASDQNVLQNSKSNPALRRYQVNVLVNSSDGEGAPVYYESNPTYLNLVGRVEQMAQMGALITDFTLIKPGRLHQANGGYLLLDAQEVVSQPYAWVGLKRALEFEQIRIESPTQMMSLTSTISLEPEPIPLDIKVILLGDRMIYYLLSQSDPDFNELFKVEADFSEVVERTPENQLLYARMIATIIRREELLPFDQSAVGRVIDHSSRLVSDSERLTMQVQAVVDLMEEASHWATVNGSTIVTTEHVQQALDAKIFRADRTRERMEEQVLRETILIDTSGAKVGQINGLAVLQLGNFAFGRVSRITARVRIGKGEVVDIEREVAMSGPLHSKGVLILSSFLSARYAVDQPLSLTASLVFEQSYGGIDGDSASSTELYALLSAIAQVPIRQSLAVTGSVNQYGEVQAIGGVNEKIEAFFDLCHARGLTGEQGVLIPIANVKHLMLRHDVIAAAQAGQFHIYPIETIDQGIEVLTDVPAGEPNANGQYPVDSINRLVADRLAHFVEKRLEFDQASSRE